MDEITEDIAIQLSADPTRLNLEICLRRIRVHQEALRQARDGMDKAIYDLLRSREFVEALEQRSQILEARVYLLMGASEAEP